MLCTLNFAPMLRGSSAQSINIAFGSSTSRPLGKCFSRAATSLIRTTATALPLCLTLCAPIAAQNIFEDGGSDLQRLKDLDEQAKRDATKLKETTRIERSFDAGTVAAVPSFAEILETQPELVEMLGLETVAGELRQSAAPDYREYGVVFVSFSMPDATLRQLALQADEYGFTTVFQGLVNNTFKDTLAKLGEVFEGDLEDLRGFSINPTVFARFDIKAVPAFVFLDQPLEPCTSQGCADEPAPEHDVVYGNIPFRDAAEIVVNEGGVGAFAAQTLIAEYEQKQTEIAE